MKRFSFATKEREEKDAGRSKKRRWEFLKTVHYPCITEMTPPLLWNALMCSTPWAAGSTFSTISFSSI